MMKGKESVVPRVLVDLTQKLNHKVTLSVKTKVERLLKKIDMSKGSQAESLQQKLEEVDEWEKPKTNSAEDTPSLSSSSCFGASD